MVTENQADAWLGQQVGQHIDYDGQFNQQCVDFFNYYYNFVTGRSPYSDGLHSPAVDGAKDLWDVRVDGFDYIPDSNSLRPNVGDILIYGSSWGGGLGHVELCRWSDAGGCHVVGENEHNNANEGVVEVYRSWASMRGLLGVMRPKFSPEVPVIINDPLPPTQPEVPNEPIQPTTPVQTPSTNPETTTPVSPVPSTGTTEPEVSATPVVVTVNKPWIDNVPDWLKRILHTVWQAAGGALLTGLTAAHSAHDVQVALFTAYTAGFAVLKAAIVTCFTNKEK